ncbi:SWIB/MDM2 domain-containing protein [Amphibiibacter pelophylacis]|uniref:SWIB/MDM2 domain-containing protein n=1 Tax=Amphibiibacter pelophylacis TaxID=1799477 RepID=A0ACC6P1B3_9BURK
MATKKAAPAKAAPAKAAAAPEKKAAGSAFMKPMKISADLAKVIGADPAPRTEVTKKIWDYIKKHKLQNPENKRMIKADAKLKVIFGKDEVSMFEMTKLVSAHLS